MTLLHSMASLFDSVHNLHGKGPVAFTFCTATMWIIWWLFIGARSHANRPFPASHWASVSLKRFPLKRNCTSAWQNQTSTPNWPHSTAAKRPSTQAPDIRTVCSERSRRAFTNRFHSDSILLEVFAADSIPQFGRITQLTPHCSIRV